MLTYKAMSESDVWAKAGYSHGVLRVCIDEAKNSRVLPTTLSMAVGELFFAGQSHPLYTYNQMIFDDHLTQGKINSDACAEIVPFYKDLLRVATKIQHWKDIVKKISHDSERAALYFHCEKISLNSVELNNKLAALSEQYRHSVKYLGFYQMNVNKYQFEENDKLAEKCATL